MSYDERFVSEKWLKDNGYVVKHISSVPYTHIGKSKYLCGAKYIIKNFDKNFKIENNMFEDNSNKETKKIVSFFYTNIGDELILYYHVERNNCNSKFKKFEIRGCAENLTCIGAITWYKKEYLLEAKQDLERFLISFLDNNCISIEKDLTLSQINSLLSEKKTTEIKISNLEQSLKEQYEISSLS